MPDTLILNANGLPLGSLPLSSLSWQAAVKMQFLESVQVVASYEDWILHSQNLEIAVPAILLLRDYKAVSHRIKFNRNNVLLRDDHLCQYCGFDGRSNRSLLTMDHVIPRYHGGMTSWSNVVTACQTCNTRKPHYTVMKPRCVPAPPNYYDLVAKAHRHPIWVPHESWIEFTGWDSSLIRIGAGSRGGDLALDRDFL